MGTTASALRRGCTLDAFASICGGSGAGAGEQIAAAAVDGAAVDGDIAHLLTFGRELLRESAEASLLQLAVDSENTAAWQRLRRNMEIVHSFVQDVEAQPDRSTLSEGNIRRLNAVNQKLHQVNGESFAKGGTVATVCEGMVELAATLFRGSEPEELMSYLHCVAGAYHRLVSEDQEGASALASSSRAAESYNEATACAAGLPAYHPSRFAALLEATSFMHVLGLQERASVVTFAAIARAMEAYVARQDPQQPRLGRHGEEMKVPCGVDDTSLLAFDAHMEVLCEVDCDALFGLNPASLWGSELSAADAKHASAAAQQAMRAGGFAFDIPLDAVRDAVTARGSADEAGGCPDAYSEELSDITVDTDVTDAAEPARGGWGAAAAAAALRGSCRDCLS